MKTEHPHDDDGWRRTIQAVEGWLALGAAQEAWRELDALDMTRWTRLAVLHQVARVLVALGRVKQARKAVQALVRITPQLRMTLLDDPSFDAVWQRRLRGTVFAKVHLLSCPVAGSILSG